MIQIPFCPESKMRDPFSLINSSLVHCHPPTPTKVQLVDLGSLGSTSTLTVMVLNMLLRGPGVMIPSDLLPVLTIDLQTTQRCAGAVTDHSSVRTLRNQETLTESTPRMLVWDGTGSVA